MRCSRCSRDNRAGSRFCRFCGESLPAACPACGAEVAPDGAFCDRCGAKLGTSTPSAPPRESAEERSPRVYTPAHLAERILRSRSAIEGERKHVAVLFADVAGFTGIAERLGAEETHAMMDRCFELLLGPVHHYEGTVNQFTGDGIMALFGAPLALEDAPRRAVSAALAMQREIAPLQRELATAHGIDFRMRIGIHTGPVVVGKIGNDLRMDYTAVGDTTNLAARLEAGCPGGAVLISEAMQRRTAGFFESRDLGLLDAKGKPEGVHAFEVLAERPARERVEALAGAGGGLTPFTGRDRELGLLREAWESARAGAGQVVFLVGEAGIGKSRLLYEFRRGLEAEPHAFSEGRCASYGAASAFLPLVDALRRLFGIDDADQEGAALSKIETAVTGLQGELAWTLPFLRRLLSLPAGDEAVERLDPGSRRSETFRALKTLALRLAEQQPLVLVVEDLHWIDPASEEFLAFLGDAVPAARVLLVLSHRPGYRHPFGDRSYHVRINLRALSANEMGTLAGALLGTAEVAEDVRDLLARRAEGNPLFIEEVTKALVEDGTLEKRAGRAVLARGSEAVHVPHSIQGVLMARLDRLADEPKQALQIASVIGREFALRLLGRISEAGEKISAVVAELRAVELVYEKTLHPELAYMFKHALVHDVAYESILGARRRSLHRSIGIAIEELYADRLAEHYETLAHHFARAEDWERALLYHERAVEKAVAAFATRAAVEHCQAALAIAARLGDSVPAERRRRLEEQLALAHFYLSEFAPSAEAHMRAAEGAEADVRVLNLAYAGHAYVWAHQNDAARRAVDAAVELARARCIPDAEAFALTIRSFLGVVVDGDVAGFRNATAAALRVCEKTGREDITALLHHCLAESSEWSGDYPQAIVHGERAIEIGRRLRLAHLVIWPTWFLGKAHCSLGDYGRAIRELEQAYEITNRIGDRAWKTRVLNTLGWCFAEIGSHGRAREYNERAAALAYEIGDHEIIANAEINLGGNHLALGDVDGARQYLEGLRDGLEKRHPFQRWRYSMHLWDALGRVALVRGQPERSEELAREELARAARHESPKIAARAQTLLGRALLEQDRREEAEHALRSAHVVAERIGYARGAWQALTLLGALQRRAARDGEAQASLAAARTLVGRLAGTLPDAELRRDLLASADSTP